LKLNFEFECDGGGSVVAMALNTGFKAARIWREYLRAV
jgi:hypothetical protein